MKVLKYEAHNVMRLSDVEMDMAGHHLFLVGGKNGQGKTSALTALLMALCGRSGMESYPEVALKTGEEEGWVKVSLGGSDDDLQESIGLTVELYLKRKRGGQVVESFRILDSAGEEAPEPRTLLRRLCQLKAFDPLQFERMEPKEQKATLERLLGLDFTSSRAEHKRLYDKRTEVNRDATKIKGQLDKLVFHKDAPDKEVSTEELLEELERRQEKNKNNAALRSVAVNMREAKCRQEQLVNRLLVELDELGKKIAKEEDALAQLVHNANESTTNAAQLVDADEAEIRQQIRDADKVNTQVRENLKKLDADAQLDDLIKESEELTERMEAIDLTEKELLKSAKWPVPGMSIDDQGVLLNGLPFGQASQSQRIMASVEVGCSLNPKLKLLVCEDGSALDEDSLAALDSALKAKDFQMIVEIVTRTSQDEELCSVVVENGTLKKARV